MKICPKCGNQIGDEAFFCNNCGFSFSESSGGSTQEGTDNISGTNTENTAQQGMNGQNTQGQYQQNAYRQPYMNYDPKDHTGEFDPRDIEDNRLFASLPYFFGILGILAALLVPESAFTRFHVKAEIKLVIASVIVCLAFIVPVLGWIVGGVCLTVLAVIKIIAIVWVLQGKAKDLPIISSIGFLR